MYRLGCLQCWNLYWLQAKVFACSAAFLLNMHAMHRINQFACTAGVIQKVHSRILWLVEFSSIAKENKLHSWILDTVPNIFLWSSSCWPADFYTSNFIYYITLWRRDMVSSLGCTNQNKFWYRASLRIKGLQKVQKIYKNCFSVKS